MSYPNQNNHQNNNRLRTGPQGYNSTPDEDDQEYDNPQYSQRNQFRGVHYEVQQYDPNLDAYLNQPTDYSGRHDDPLPPLPYHQEQQQPYPIPDINVSVYGSPTAIPSIPSPERYNNYQQEQQQSPNHRQRHRTSPPRRQEQHSPIRPLTNTYRRTSSSSVLLQQQQIDPFQSGNTLYLPPSESGVYGSSPTTNDMYINPNTHGGHIQDPEYYATAPVGTGSGVGSVVDQRDLEYFSPLQNVNRSNSTLRRLPNSLVYPDTQYAPSINDIEEDPYNNTYLMNDLGDTSNLSNSNIPIMNHLYNRSGSEQNFLQLQQQMPYLPPPQQQQQIQQQQSGYYTNLFEPYSLDQEDNIDDDFTPFPVSGDAYEINAYGAQEDDEPSFESTEESEKSINDKAEGSSSILDEYYETPKFGDPENQYEEPPEGDVPRRSKSTKGIKVKMIDGNLILDCEVSDQLLSKYPNPVTPQDREFGYMRYQAATCDPQDFASSKFTLRQLCYFQPRQTEIMIVITMYNEDDVLLARTLQGVFKNIKHLTSKTRSSTWGKDLWKKIVVCIVSDGRTKINPRSQLLLAALGVYQEGFAKNMVNDKEVVSHIYEYTTMVGISKVKDGQVKLTTQKTVPVQLLFCLKEKNQKKINSHRWCFQAFAPILNPNVVVLLDAGTQPAGDSIYHLWKLFDKDQSVAGACGEIKAMLNPQIHKMMWEMVRKPIVYAQNFEYKISNILDKPMESVFGFVSVLPGAFSAYRYVALQNDVNGVGPLLSYFKGETLHNTDAGLFTANMYLAEDRILCFELVAKRDCHWVLKYVQLASAKTDVPDQLPEFILQRRRWLNGSFFAAIYSLVHFFNIWRSSHSIIRKIFFHIQFIYQFINLLVSWFSLGSYFLVFRILTISLSDPSLRMERVGNILSVLFLWLYLASIVTTFVLSFGNKPQGTKRFYVVIVWFFAILMAYMIFASVYMSVYAVRQMIADNGGTITFVELFKNARFRDLVVATLSTYLLYFVGSLMFLDPWHMFTSFIQYILLSPAYINVLNIYAFCNIHDISWGTKGDTGAKMDLGVAKQSSTEGKFYIEIPTTKEEVDEAYTRQINILLKPEDNTRSPPDAEEKEKDYYAFIRSMTVLFWMVSNFALIAVVLETGGIDQLRGDDLTTTTPVATTPGIASNNSEIFLTVILWIVAFMALFRFLGGVAYTILKIVGK